MLRRLLAAALTLGLLIVASVAVASPKAKRINLSVGDSLVDEPVTQPAAVLFRLRLSHRTPRTLRVKVSTVSGSATEGQDFRAVRRTVRIPKRHLGVTVPVTILPDADPEGV